MKLNLFLIFSIGFPLIAGEIRFGELQTAALENSHRLKVRGIDTKIEQARLGSLTSSLYPQLSLGYNGEYSKNLDSAASGNIMVGDMTISPNTLYKNFFALSKLSHTELDLHLERLSMLTQNETEALNETRSKLTMTERLMASPQNYRWDAELFKKKAA